MSQVELLPQQDLVKTGPVDEADWNYRPLLGWISRQRFRMVVELLGDSQRGGKASFHQLLEIGYGSGVLLPTLARYCDRLYGVDIHDKGADVKARFDQLGLSVELRQESFASTSFPRGTFDCIVGVSCVEFADDPCAALEELRRILAPEGALILITPADHWIADTGLRLLTGRQGKDFFGERRAIVRASIPKLFTIERQIRFPSFLGRLASLYYGYRLRSPLRLQSSK